MSSDIISSASSKRKANTTFDPAAASKRLRHASSFISSSSTICADAATTSSELKKEPFSLHRSLNKAGGCGDENADSTCPVQFRSAKDTAGLNRLSCTDFVTRSSETTSKKSCVTFAWQDSSEIGDADRDQVETVTNRRKLEAFESCKGKLEMELASAIERNHLLSAHRDSTFSTANAAAEDSGDDCGTQSTDKNVKDVSTDDQGDQCANAPVFVLSSGRLNREEEARLGIRPPTVDNEFDDYFSQLIL